MRKAPLASAIITCAMFVATPSVSSAQTQPTYIVIRVVDALIAPLKASGQPWDEGSNYITQVDLNAIASALTTVNPYAALLPLLGPLSKGFQPPDVQGTADLLYYGQEWAGTSISLPRIPNSYTPAWLTADAMPSVQFIAGMKLRIRLIDWDPIGGSDPIGMIILGSNELLTALQNGGRTTRFYVANQTQNQAYYIGISVMQGVAPSTTDDD